MSPPTTLRMASRRCTSTRNPTSFAPTLHHPHRPTTAAPATTATGMTAAPRRPATGGARTGTTHATPTATVTQTGPAPRAPTAPTAESLTASPRAANPAASPPHKGLTGYGATRALQPKGKVQKMAAALEGASPCRVPGPEPCQQTPP